MKKLLLQNVNTKEVRNVSLYSTIHNDKCQIRRSSLEGLYLSEPNQTPVGSVEFCHAYAKIHDIKIKTIDTYPKELYSFLGRSIIKTNKGACDRGKFLKPVDVKLFTGFIGKTDEENQAEFDALSDNTMLYQSEYIDIVSEYRYYVKDKKVLGYGRYDQNEVIDAPKPNYRVVFDAIGFLEASCYAIDFGVLKSGETVLIEVNNPYAIGFYQEGNMDAEKYTNFLIDGWKGITDAYPS